MTKLERIEIQKQRLLDMKAHENELRLKGLKYIAGIDEVGRGPLAGPVYAACVIMPENFEVLGINDSKKLTAKKRDEFFDLITESAVAYGIGIVDNKEIDSINILEATKKAMIKAIHACNKMLSEKIGTDAQIDILLIDALRIDIDIRQESIVKGDEKCLSIAAASILAKVSRDRYMVEMEDIYPGYGFFSNKGYGTAAHYDGLNEFGITPIHRKSFLKNFSSEQDIARKTIKATNGGNMAKKIYAVKKGRITGILMTWEECKASVDGFANAEYKSFTDVDEALDYIGLSRTGSLLNTDVKSKGFVAQEKKLPSGIRAYVDGSFDEATGRFSCGAVIVKTDEEGKTDIVELNSAFNDEEFAKHRNVAGEVMGAKLAIDYAIDNDIKEITIYHDYEGIEKWANGLWKTNNPLTKAYKAYVADARKKIKIDFVKVKAHTGDKYNEMADRLAKKALDM